MSSLNWKGFFVRHGSFCVCAQPIRDVVTMCLRPANERRRYIVTSYLIGWAHTQNDPCNCVSMFIFASVVTRTCILRNIYRYKPWKYRSNSMISIDSMHLCVTFQPINMLRAFISLVLVAVCLLQQSQGGRGVGGLKCWMKTFNNWHLLMSLYWLTPN